MTQERVTEKNLRYMDWNPYLHSVNDDLNIINRCATQSYNLGKWKVKEFAINLQIFYYSREPYIMQPKTIETINKILDQLHNSSFIDDYEKRKPDAIEYEYKAIKTLLQCQRVIVRNLSQSKIIPEIDITIRDKPNPDYEDVAV
jgi:hypothetical protein